MSQEKYHYFYRMLPNPILDDIPANDGEITRVIIFRACYACYFS